MYENQFGKGVIWPFQRNGQGDVVRAEGEKLLNSDIASLVGINKGELRWDKDRGTELMKLLHRRFSKDAISSMAQHMVGEAMDAYEKRVRLTKVEAKIVDGKLKLSTSYVPLGYSRSVTASTVEQEIG
jgi:phage baseplate assembly protein W